MKRLSQSDIVPIAACGLLSGAIALVGALAINSGLEAADVLGFIGGVAGAALGAWLAVLGALEVERRKERLARAKANRRLVHSLLSIRLLLEQFEQVDLTHPPGLTLVFLFERQVQLSRALDGYAWAKAASPIETLSVFANMQNAEKQVLLFTKLLEQVLERQFDDERDLRNSIAPTIQLIGPAKTALNVAVDKIEPGVRRKLDKN